MSGQRTRGAPAHLRQRSTAAIILTRTDPRPAGGKPTSSGWAGTGAADVRPRGSGLWPAVLTWVVLGAAIVGLWALLLLGDSFGISG